MNALCVRAVRWGKHRIRLMPGWGATFRHIDYTVDQEADVRARKASGHGPAELTSVRQPANTAAGKLLDATDGPTSAVTLAGNFNLYHEGIDSVEDAARAVIAGTLAATFHEAIEWVTVDGQRVANPHPAGDKQWEWVMERMLEIVDNYADKWPAPNEETSA